MNAVQLGEPIPGTQLIRRFQHGSEISPMYVPARNEVEVQQNAIEAATAAGWRAVTVWGTTFVCFGGEWYAWGFARDPSN